VVVPNGLPCNPHRFGSLVTPRGEPIACRHKKVIVVHAGLRAPAQHSVSGTNHVVEVSARGCRRIVPSQPFAARLPLIHRRLGIPVAFGRPLLDPLVEAWEPHCARHAGHARGLLLGIERGGLPHVSATLHRQHLIADDAAPRVPVCSVPIGPLAGAKFRACCLLRPVPVGIGGLPALSFGSVVSSGGFGVGRTGGFPGDVPLRGLPIGASGQHFAHRLCRVTGGIGTVCSPCRRGHVALGGNQAQT